MKLTVIFLLTLLLTSNSFLIKGRGYSSIIKDLLPSACYDGKVSYSNANTKYEVLSDMSYDQLKNKFESMFGFGIGVSLLGLNFKNEFLNQVKSTHTRTVVNFMINYKTEASIEFDVGEKVLSEYGRSVYQNGKNRLFEVICGDQIVSKADLEAVLVISFIFTHDNTTEIKELSNKFSFNFLELVKYDLKTELTDSKKYDSINIEIKAFQTGGLPEKLSNIFFTKDGSLPVVSCSPRNLEDCYKIKQAFNDYIRNDFNNQIKNIDDLSLVNYKSLKMIPIKNLLLKFDPFDFSDSKYKTVNDIRNDIRYLYNECLYYLEYVTYAHDCVLGEKSIPIIKALNIKSRLASVISIVKNNFLLFSKDSKIFSKYDECFYASEGLKECEFSKDQINKYYTFLPVDSFDILNEFKNKSFKGYEYDNPFKLSFYSSDYTLQLIKPRNEHENQDDFDLDLLGLLD